MKMVWMFLTMISTSHAKNCFREQSVLKDGDFEVKISRYPAQSTKNIIIMPPTGGINIIDRSYGRNFCQAGFNVIVIERWSGDDELTWDFGIHNRLYTKAQKAIEITLRQFPLKEFVGILGTSVGGMHAATATGKFEQIKASFVIAGGADIAGIIVHSQQQAMLDGKAKRYELFKIKDDADYEEQLRPHIMLDAVHLKGHIGKKLGMVLATQDTVLPVKNQRILKEVWQPEKVIVLENDHFWAIIKSWLFYQDEIIDFFVKSSN